MITSPPALALPPLAGCPLAGKTSFKMGGPVDWLLQPSNLTELQACLTWLRVTDQPWRLLGRGTNLLIDDQGISGGVIKLAGDFTQIQILPQGQIRVGAGAGDAALARAARQAGLAGLEFLSTIPGSLGGAVAMNAGAHGHDVSQVLVEVVILTPQGQVETWQAAELGLGYRSSRLRSGGGVCLSALLQLQPGEETAIAALETSLKQQRATTQPHEFPNCGSLFKNPTGLSTGRLLDELGFKGKTWGQVRLSPRHANFLENLGNATLAQVEAAIAEAQAAARSQRGVELVLEAEIWKNP